MCVAGRNESSSGPPRSRILWPVVSPPVVRVTSTKEQTRSRFVKIKDDREDSSSRAETSSTLEPFPHPPVTRAKDRRKDETATEVSRFVEHSPPASFREARLALNFKGSFKYPASDWSEVNALASFADEQSEYKVRSDSNVVSVVSSSPKFGEKFLVTLDSPISGYTRVASTPRFLAIHRSSPARRRDAPRHRRRERQTIRRDEESKSLDRYEDKESTREKNELTTTTTTRSRNEERSRTVESAITMSHGVTTMTSRTNKTVSTDGSLVDVNFQKPTERYESQIMTNFPQSVSNIPAGNINDFHKDQTELTFNSTPRTISRISENLLNSDNSYMANYPAGKQPEALMIDIAKDAPVAGRRSTERRDRHVKRIASKDSRADKLTNNVTEENSSSDLNPDGSRDENLVRDLGSLKEPGLASTWTTLSELAVRKHKTPSESTVTEEILVRTRQITEQSLPELPIIGTDALKLGATVGATNPMDIGIASLDNHKAIRVRSFERTKDGNEEQGDIDSDTSSFSSRSVSDHFDHKDEPLKDEETPSLAEKVATSQFGANQITFAKSRYSNTKNTTKPLINFSDGKSNKTFYEIKPSVITDMDRPNDLDYATTTRQSFDKFLLSSVPSVFGKYGPYFLDNQDGRNVTRRIGSTVQLDCRIGFLGNRTVSLFIHSVRSKIIIKFPLSAHWVSQTQCVKPGSTRRGVLSLGLPDPECTPPGCQPFRRFSLTQKISTFVLKVHENFTPGQNDPVCQ